MIDSITKKRIVVESDPECGLYVRVSDWEDKDSLEDMEKYDIDCDSYKPEIDAEGNEVAYLLFFSSGIEKAFLQKIIDGISVNGI